ncbi:hypothetical protein [Priestia taiwanensis]|nr:hypothetical protein [Priestia taiwanensis]
MKKTAFCLRLRGETFFRDELCCLGWQFAEILTRLIEYTEGHHWYVFDVAGGGHVSFLELFPRNSEGMCVICSTEELIQKVKKVNQFESGVFIAIKKGEPVEWDIHYLPETEEEEGLQHPLAAIEIRLFDFSYFEIYGNDLAVERMFQMMER